MRHLSPLVVSWMLTGCPKGAPPAPVEIEAPQATRVVSSSADLVGAKGVRAVVTGRLERRAAAEGGPEGTAIVLSDGAAVFVSEGAPPDGWDWLLGTQVRVQGSLHETAPAGPSVPWLAAPESPMPADVQMGLGSPR